MSSVIDTISEGFSQAAEAVVDGLMYVLKAIASGVEAWVMLLIGEDVLNACQEIANKFETAWTAVKSALEAANQFLPLKEAFATIIIMWLLRFAIVSIRWVLKFVPTLSS